MHTVVRQLYIELITRCKALTRVLHLWVYFKSCYIPESRCAPLVHC